MRIPHQLMRGAPGPCVRACVRGCVRAWMRAWMKERCGGMRPPAASSAPALQSAGADGAVGLPLLTLTTRCRL
jgi:hypothetical protein